MSITHHTPTTLAYARSLLELAEQRQEVEPVGLELSQLAEVIEQNPVFAEFLANPSVGVEKRTRVLNNTFGGKLSPLVNNLLGVLNKRGALHSLSNIIEAFDELLDEKLGKIEVDLIVVQALTEDMLQDVRQRIADALKKDVVLHQYVDESIIGGLILRVQDKLIDSSVRTELTALRQRMLRAAWR